LETPFPAYQGDEPYVFICYAHDDQAVVHPEITWLHEQGVNVWYDEGISPGEEWSEELGQAIEGAERFLYFVSPRSVASRHCRNELNFAQNHDKPMLSVYLEETELPSGVELVISASQAILKPDLSKTDYRARLLRALGRANDSPSTLGAARAPTKATPRPRPWQLAVLLILVVCAGGVLWLLDQPAPAGHALDRSLTLLPFSVVGADADAATYSAALTEELRIVLAGYPELRTVAVPDEIDPQEADEASYVLRGNVQRMGERMRLRAHLTRTDDRHAVWAKTFDLPVTNGTPDAAELATIVGQSVRLQLMIDQRCESVRRTTRSHEAADAHCAAVTDAYGGAQGGNPDPHLALIQALRAVALDPDIVDAHVQVGLNYTWLANGGQMDWREATRQARAALDRSLALAPNDPQVLGLRGRIEDLEMNYPAAEASFRESLAREPTLPRTGPIHGRLGTLALAQNHLGEALEHLRRSLRIDDSNAMQHMTYASVLGYTGENSEAIRAADAGLGLADSGSLHARLVSAKVAAHDALGERLQANAILDEALASVGSESKPVLAQTLASLGRTEEARQLLAVLEELERPPTALMVETYAQLRDDRAFDWMHKAIDRHDILITHTLRANPIYSELHEDPRWAEVMAHLETEEAKARAGGGVAPE